MEKRKITNDRKQSKTNPKGKLRTREMTVVAPDAKVAIDMIYACYVPASAGFTDNFTAQVEEIRLKAKQPPEPKFESSSCREN